MKSYALEDLAACLRDLELGEGRRVLVHSALFPLGRVAGTPPAEWANAILEVLLDVLGKSGTLAAPTFTFAFCRGTTYDPRTSPSERMGVLSEAIRTRQGARRTPHPMQSLALIGPLAASVCAPDLPSAYQAGGPFDRLLEHEFDLLLLGASVQAASLVHLAEERVGVPYRYRKSFTAPYVHEGSANERTYKMYVRDLDLDPRLTLHPVQERLEAAGTWRSRRLGGGVVAACSCRDFVEASINLLRDDPWALVHGGAP